MSESIGFPWPGPTNERIKRLEGTISRVRSLHKPVCEPSGDGCTDDDCPVRVCKGCGDDYPCPTIRALDGVE